MKKKNIIQYLIIANLVLIFFYLVQKFTVIRNFKNVLVGVVLIPFSFGIFLFYILRPLNNIFLKKGLKSSKAATLTILIFIVIIAAIGKFFGEYFWKQVMNLKVLFTSTIEEENIIGLIKTYVKSESIITIAENLFSKFIDYINLIVVNAKMAFDTGLMIFSDVLLVILIVLFLLKDGDKFKPAILEYCPHKYEDLVSNTLSEADRVLSTYVIGQATVALALSSMVFIGYIIIKMPSALILAFTTFILAFIPFVGFFISMIIPYIIAIVMGIKMLIRLSVLLIIAQTLKGRVVVPFIMGRAMKIHPITDIVLVVGAAAIGGPFAAFSVVPIYSVIKVIIKNTELKKKLLKGINIDKVEKV